jgi:hypothetical protein
MSRGGEREERVFLGSMAYQCSGSQKRGALLLFHQSGALKSTQATLVLPLTSQHVSEQSLQPGVTGAHGI